MAAAVPALLLLALALGVVPLAPPLSIGGLLVLAAMALRLQRHRWPRRRRLAVVLAVLMAWNLGLQGQPRPGRHDPVRLIPTGSEATPAQLRGRLLSDPQPDPQGGGCSALLQLGHGRTELRFSACPTVLRQGWRLEASGRLQRPRPATHPLLSGTAERLARQGSWSRLQVERWAVLDRPATPVADLRRRMAGALLDSGGPEAGGVLAALVLGSAVVPVPAAVREAFRAAGLSHALAASGFHLTVLLGAVMGIGRFAARPVRWALALGAMALFLLLAGPQPSVVRAVAMGAMAFVVQESGRRARPLGVLLLCVLLTLLAAPAWLLDVGFQLSVAATAGLMLSAGSLEHGLGRRLPNWAATAIAVPLAASLWTLPLQLLHFGALPLYAVPANLLAAPLLTPLTLGAMAMAVAAVVLPALLPLLAWGLVPLTRLFVELAQRVAALPVAQWQLGRMAPLPALLLGLGLLPWLLELSGCPPQRRRLLRRCGAVLMAAMLAMHLTQLSGDRLLLVHDGPRALLLAGHGGRGALISRQADDRSCSSARQLASGLGLQRYDWILLLDPVAPQRPACWRALTPTLLAPQDGSSPLAPGQRLASPGLVASPLAADSQALLLQAGALRWGLLPDRQSWWSWSRSTAPPPRVDGLWLGFEPGPAERRRLPALPRQRLWWAAAGSDSGWRQA